MPVAYTTARTALAPYVDNGVAATDTSRIDQRIDEAQRRLVDHYNFVSRREESARTALVWQAGGTTGNPSTANLIVDNLDATKNMILALWREENNQLDLATNLETKAYSYIERNITNEVERERRTSFETLATSGQNTFGGLTGRVGLETLVQYRLPESRIKSFINQAYQQAIDHHNFVSRREDKSRPALTFNALSGNSDAFNALLPIEVVRLLSLALIINDSGGDGTGLKQQALELIDRNVTTLVEQTRRDAAGEEGRLHNELPEGVKVPTARLTQYLNQAATDAGSHWDFLARREDYSSGTKPSPFPFEVRKKLVESYIATANAAVEIASALKQDAFSLIERNLMAQVEAARRAAGGEAGQLHNELPEGVRVSTTRMNTYIAQAATEAGAHWDFLARREDYSSGTKPNPFSYEVRKMLVESYLATSNAAVEVATAKKQAAFDAIERDLMAQVEAARRATAGEAGQLHNELPDGVKIPTARINAYLTQAATEAGAHWDFLARREDYSSGTKPNPFSYEVRKKLVESYLATANALPDVAAALKQAVFAVIERDVMKDVETIRRSIGGTEGRLHNELPDGVKISTGRLTTYLSQAATEAGAHWDFIARREDYSSGTKPNPFSYEVLKCLVESYVAVSVGAVEVAAAKKQEAFATIERDLMAGVEAARRVTAGDEGKLHNELPDGVKIPTARLTTYLTQAATEAGAHWDFLARREDYSSGTKPNPFAYEVLKKLVESYIATSRDDKEMASALKQEALATIERDLMAGVEAARRGYTAVAEVGRLHNELPEGVKIPTARLSTYLTQAGTDAGSHYDFLARREDYAGGTKPNPFPFEVLKKLVESYLATFNGAVDVAAKLKDEALSLVERNLMQSIENTRRTAANDEGKLHNELPDGVKIPTARLTTYLAQAQTEASAHYSFLSRREDYAGGTTPNPFPYEVRKKLVESYLATSSGAVDAAAALKQEALALVERNLMQEIEAARRVVGGEAGRLHNELPEGVKIPTSRMNEYLTQSATDAGAHWDFLARREDYSSGTKPSPFPFEVRKKLVESYIATATAAPDVAASLKQESFAIIERNLMAQVEAARRAAAGDEGRLHNELPSGLQTPTSRLTTHLSQASTEIAAQQAFLQRREDYNGAIPAPTYEQRKLLVESYIAALAGQADLAAVLKQQALALVERDVMQAIESTRRATRQTLLATDSDSFGYYWGRVGLELPEAYRLSDNAVQRMVNSAEEQLMAAGKWVGTVAEYILSVSTTGEFFLPVEIETILFMSFDGDPKPVHDRLNEWLHGGTGYRESDDTWRQGAVDRGESVDPADNVLKRKYWITLPNEVPVVRILGKRRFIPHTSNLDKMYLRSYQAIYEATKGLLLGGENLTPQMEKAKEKLASQIAQQNFSGNKGSAHTRRVLAFR